MGRSVEVSDSKQTQFSVKQAGLEPGTDYEVRVVPWLKTEQLVSKGTPSGGVLFRTSQPSGKGSMIKDTSK